MEESARVATELSAEARRDARQHGHGAYGLPTRVQWACREEVAYPRAPVATDVSGTRDVIPDDSYGLVIPPDDPEALAEAIGRLIADPDLRRDMGRRTRARVIGHFSTQRMAREYDDLFQEVLAGTAARSWKPAIPSQPPP